MQHKLVSDLLTVRINSFGAELASIKNNAGLEFIWIAKKDVWGRHAPILFPIVGRLKDNKYTLNNKTYALAQHGFARDNDFTLTQGNDQTCTFQLNASDETRKAYPFDFHLQITYTLNGNALTCAYKVKNPSQSEIIFSIGAHPGFNCPLTTTETFEDYYLEFEKNSFVQTTLADGLTSGKKEFETFCKIVYLSKTLFENDALVFEDNQIDKIVLRSSKSSHQIVLTCKDWPCFGIWTKKGTTEFICLEPWFGIADDVNSMHELRHKPEMIRLGAQKVFECNFSIQAE